MRKFQIATAIFNKRCVFHPKSRVSVFQGSGSSETPLLARIPRLSARLLKPDGVFHCFRGGPAALGSASRRKRDAISILRSRGIIRVVVFDGADLFSLVCFDLLAYTRSSDEEIL